MEARSKYGATEKDVSILRYLSGIAPAVRTWKSFHFPLKNAGYAYLKVQHLPHDFQILERIVFTKDDGSKHHGTIVGEHKGKLYINLDIHFYAQPVNFDHTKQPIKLDDSGITEFSSTIEFEHKYLGFYLETHDQFLKKLSSEKPTAFKNNFWASMSRNERYLNNTKIIEKTLDRVKGFK